MIASPNQPDLLPEAYLRREEQSPVKHEYINGRAYAMAGASDAHVTISLNVAALLRNHVRGTGCRVYRFDMKAHLERSNIYYYPDVMVTCDERDRRLTTCKQHPCLIVKVLSKSTEAFDRGDKFADYQNLETLQEYILISTTRQRVDRFRRNTEGLWILQSLTPGTLLQLTSVDFQVEVDALYEDVVLTSETPEGTVELA